MKRQSLGVLLSFALFAFWAAFAETVDTDRTVTLTADSNTSYEISDGVTLTIEVASGATYSLSGQITGTGTAKLCKTGLGTLALSNGNNDIPGGIDITEGTVRADAQGCLGDGPVSIAQGDSTKGNLTFNASGSIFNNPITITGTRSKSRVYALSAPVSVTLNGNVSVSPGAHIENANGSVMTFNGNLEASSSKELYFRTITGGSYVLNGRVVAGVAELGSTSSSKGNVYFNGALAYRAEVNGKVDTEPETVWTSSNPEAASVNRYTGVISAVAPGTTTITADSEGVTATAEVTVYFKLEGIALNKSTTKIDIDQSETLTVIYDPGNTSDNRDISWTSSDDTVASVDQNGVVTAHKKGKATITATGFGGVKATCTVQVLIPMTAITFDNSAVTIPRGTRQKVPFTVSPSNTTDTYTVTSSNESVATVDKFGNVTAKKIGTAVITVTSSRGLEQTCVVTVNSPASSITLSEDSKALFVGKTFTLTTEMSPKDTTDGVTWTSSDEDVAVVTPNGLVTAISKGNATITATADSGVSANCEVTVESDIAATTIYLAYQETDYDGDEKLPGVSVYYNGEKLVEDTDYCLSYLDNIDAGNASVYVTSLHDGTEVEKNFTIHPLTVKALDISYKTSMTYTGSPLKSVEEIIYQSLRLTEGTDYKLEYVNNTNAGQATVTISGLGNFSDSTTKTFTITPKSANQLTVTLGTTSYQYDGIAKEPTVTVKDGAKELTEGTDYEVRYSKNTNTGDAVVTVTGLNNYGGSTTAGFKIYAKSLADAQMSLGKTVFAFDGTEKRPEVTVTDGEVVLKENTDYKVEYKDNKESGTATATVTGQGNYTGTLAADFKIIRLGDINQNGTVEIQDVTVLQRHLAEFTNSDGTPIVDETNEEILKIADVDHNGEITIADITLIQRFLAEFTDTLG